MELEQPTEEQIERVLEWYEKDPGDALVGDEPLSGITLEELKAIFSPDEDEDPDLFLHYEVEAADVARLQQAVDHQIDLGAYDYFVAAYRREEDS